MDARFSDDLTLAMAAGFDRAGGAVDRATMSGRTPPHRTGYALVAVVTNTSYWNPDLPTLRYLERPDLTDLPVIAVGGGAGSTGRARRTLTEASSRTGGTVREACSVRVWRPNVESRTGRSPWRESGRWRGRWAGAPVPVAAEEL